VSATVVRLGVLGAGDFTRRETPALLASRRVRVAAVYDPRPEAAQAAAERLSARRAESAEDLVSAGDVDAVVVFTPPFTHRPLVEQAVAAGKRVITTKPLAPNVADARRIAELTADGRCLVVYKRVGSPQHHALRALFFSGEVGRLVLYRHDWAHHFPYWVPWALDPEKNGGPLVDAMIHNLNAVRDLVACPVAGLTYHGYNLTHQFPVPDTESLVVDFASGATAHLFITWAADLAIHDAQANARERVDVQYMVTSTGHLVRFETREGRAVLAATREGRVSIWPVPPLPETHYDRWVRDLEEGRPVECSAQEACRDIELLHAAFSSPGRRVEASVSSLAGG
jgi:predicted dehydrogenase